LKYGFNHRYHSSIKIAKKISDSKKFGKIINFRCVYGKSKIKTFEVGDWRSKRKYSGGGILLDQGIHMIDLILYFSGNFSEFISYISNKYWNYDVEDNAFVLMRNKKGVVASLHSTATQWQHKFSMEITFQHGFIDLKGILSGTKSYGKESITIIPKYDVKKNGKGKKLFFSKDNSWKDEVDEFVKLIFYKRKKYVGNIYEAENVMFTLNKIYRSDKKWFKYLKNIKKAKNFSNDKFLPYE
jgi:predicted dehydrogenase